MTALPEPPDARSPEDVLAEALAPEDGYTVFVGPAFGGGTGVAVTGDGKSWEVTDHKGAEWCVAKIRQAKREFQEATTPSRLAIEALQAEIERHRAYITEQADRLGTRSDFFKSRLTDWLRRTYEEETAAKVPEAKRTKTIKLSGAVVKRIAGRPSVVIEDEDAFVAAYGDDSPFVKVTRKPVLKAVLDFVKDSGGVSVRHARIEQGEATFKVEVGE